MLVRRIDILPAARICDDEKDGMVGQNRSHAACRPETRLSDVGPFHPTFAFSIVQLRFANLQAFAVPVRCGLKTWLLREGSQLVEAR